MKHNSNCLCRDCISECEICGDKNVPLESHHINFQKDCDENKRVKNKKHVEKDSKANLAVICEKCHNKIHREGGNIEHKKVRTSKGIKIVKK